MEVELSQNAIPTMWAAPKSDEKYTVQLLSFKWIKDLNYKLTVSDGQKSLVLLCNNKQTIHELIDEKKDALVNSIIAVSVKTAPHPKQPANKLIFVQALEVLQEGAALVGEPQKYEPEDMAKVTVTAPVPHEQMQEAATSASTPQTVVKSESKIEKTIESPTPKGPGLVSPDPSPPKSQSTPLNMSQSADKCVPIAQLNNYMKPMVKGRITVKDNVREFKGRDGIAKKVASIEIMDDTADMKVTFWGKAVDTYFDQLEVGKTYTFNKITLKLANTKYNSTKCPYEMSLGDQSVVEMCEDMDAPEIVFSFVGIEKLEEKINKNCDVIGIVTDVSSKTTIQLKNGKGEKDKRNVTLVDQSGKQVSLTLWDYLADEITEDNAASKDVVAIRAVRVSDYNGCSVNSTRSSIIQINPTLDAATKLQEWYQTDGAKASFTSVSSAGGGGASGPTPRHTISEIGTSDKPGLGSATDKPSYFTLKCFLTMASATKEADAQTGKKATWHYCANPDTKKKVVEDGNGWRDESTNTYMDKCQRRYIAQLVFADATGSVYMTAFDDQCKMLLGMSADELFEVEMGSADKFVEVWKRAYFKQFVCKVRAKSETWEDKSRVKCAILDMKPVDFKAESKMLLEQIAAYGV